MSLSGGLGEDVGNCKQTAGDAICLNHGGWENTESMNKRTIRPGLNASLRQESGGTDMEERDRKDELPESRHGLGVGESSAFGYKVLIETGYATYTWGAKK